MNAYVNAWLKRWVFNLDLTRECVRKAIPEFGSQYEKALPPLVDFAILGTTPRQESRVCDLGSVMDCSEIED